MDDFLAFARNLLDYDPASGHFTWKVNRGRLAKAGQKAGTRGGKNDRYLRIKINDRCYLAHRLAWLFVFGSWPTLEIDHINGDRYDNRICNLRQADRSTNMHNTRRQRAGTGVAGRGNRWSARVNWNKTEFRLGTFSSEQLAREAVQKFRRSKGLE